MECPRCKAQMDKGALLSDEGKVFFANNKSIMNKLATIGTFTFGNPLIHAWRCSHCGKVELETDTK